MKTKQEILDALPNFYGTELWHRYNPVLFPNVLLTDGALFIAESCDAFWLMDVISSHLPSLKGDAFGVARLAAGHNSALFSLTDDVPPTVTYAMQAIEYTDFPLDEIMLYVAYDGENWTILLPSEY